MPVGTYNAGAVGPAPGFAGLHTRMIELTADSGTDVVLNVASYRHAHPARAAAQQFVVTVGPINAGRDIDLLIGDSFDRATPGSPAGVWVHRVNDGPNFSPDHYMRFFRPDCTPLGLPTPCREYELATFATGATPIPAHYLFAAGATTYAGLGGTLGIGSRPLGGTAHLSAGHNVSARHLTSGQISFTGIVDADSDGNEDGSTVL